MIFEYIHGHISRFGSVCFDLTGYKGKFSNLEQLIGKSGYLTFYNMEIIYSSWREHRLVFAEFCCDGTFLDQKQMQRMFDLSGEKEQDLTYNIEKDAEDKLKTLYQAQQEMILEEISIQNSNYFKKKLTN